MSDSLRPHGLYSPWNSPGQNTRVGSYSLLQRIFPTQGSNPSLPHCRRMQADSLPSEPPRRPKNTGVDSLFLLQGIFPTQELNWSLLHYRWILYQLSYQAFPSNTCSFATDEDDWSSADNSPSCVLGTWGFLYDSIHF